MGDSPALFNSYCGIYASKIKAYLRRKAARTREALEEEIGRAIDIVTPRHAAAHFRHCVYVPL